MKWKNATIELDPRDDGLRAEDEDGGNMIDETPRWLRQLVSSIVLNLNDVELWDLADGLAPLDAGRAVAKRITVGDAGGALLPYRFRPPQRIVSLEEARARGFGACGDATAAVAAGIVIAGGAADVCYELHPTVDSYAHVRIDVGGVAIDAYPEASLDVPRCAARVRVSRETVRWRADAADRMRSQLAARRTPGAR